MSESIPYTCETGNQIRALFKDYPELRHLITEVQFIGSNTNDEEALKFLQERIAFHRKFS